MAISISVSNPPIALSSRRIWTLAASTESGIYSRLFGTEREALEELANVWFPNFHPDSGNESDILNHAAMLAALGESVEAARIWFGDFQSSYDAFGDAIVESHYIPMN